MSGRAAARPAEEHLRKSFAEGKVLDLRTGQRNRDDLAAEASWPTGRQIRADIVMDLLRGDGQAGSVMSVAGARIVGTLDLQHARVNSSLILRDCYFDEPPDLSEARAVSVCLAGSRFPSLACYGLQVEGDMDLRRVNSGRIDLFGAHIGGRFWLQAAELRSPDDKPALNAPDLTVDGGMYCRHLHAYGGISIYGAAIGSTLELREAKLVSPTGDALRAPGLTVRFDMDCSACVAVGRVDLFGAQVGGQLWLGAAHLSSGDSDWVLSAPLLKVGGGMYCNAGFSATGGVNLFGASIGSMLDFAGATLAAPSGTALRAPGCTVQADMALTSGFSAAGAIDLSGAHIEGGLRLADATFTGSTAGLRNASIRVLSGQPSHWPDEVRLRELTYTAIEPYLAAPQWLGWLQRDPDGYEPQPYEQLAAYYRRVGQDEQARTVLLAKQRHRRQRLRLPARAWGHLQDAAIGYGYRPARAFGWLVLLLAFTTAYFSVNPPRTAGSGAATFQPLIYAFDTVIPVLNLDHQQTYITTGAGQWIDWAVTTAGWVLATTVVAGITRALTRS